MTVTAPIRLAAKTAVDVEEKARTLLARRSARRELASSVHGNQVRIRILNGCPAGAAKFIGFVHNPDSDPTALFEVAQALIKSVHTVSTRKPRRLSGDRWLVLADPKGLVHPEVYRHVYPELSLPLDFNKVLLMSAGQRIEALSG